MSPSTDRIRQYLETFADAVTTPSERCAPPLLHIYPNRPPGTARVGDVARCGWVKNNHIVNHRREPVRERAAKHAVCVVCLSLWEQAHGR